MGCVVVAIWVVAIPVAVLLASTGGFGIAFAVLVLLVAGVLHVVIGRPATEPQLSKAPAAKAGRGLSSSTRVVAAPLPGQPVRLSSAGRQAVAGEYYHRAEINAAVAGREVGVVGDWESGLATTAFLIREPGNRHDRNAVAVRLRSKEDGETVLAGYLPAEDAPAWQPLLGALEGRGAVAECLALIYGTGDRNYQVVLRVAAPSSAALQNTPPPGAAILEARRECALTGEQAFQEVLGAYELGSVWATLHPAVVAAGKYQGEPTLEARIDGSTVGAMTARQGQRYRSLIDLGMVACEATIFDGARHREVSLMLPRVD